MFLRWTKASSVRCCIAMVFTVTTTVVTAAPAHAAAVLVPTAQVPLNIAAGQYYRNVLVDNAAGHHLAFVTAGPYLEAVDLNALAVTAVQGTVENPASGYLATDGPRDAVIVNNRLGRLTSYTEHHLNVLANRTIDDRDTALTMDTKNHVVIAMRSCSLEGATPSEGGCGQGRLDVFTVPHLYTEKPILLPRNPVAVVFDGPLDEFFVAEADGSLTVIDAATRTVMYSLQLRIQGVPIGEPSALAVDPLAHVLYVGLVSGAELTFNTDKLDFFDSPVAGFQAGKLPDWVDDMTVDLTHHVAYASDIDQDVDQILPDVGTQSFENGDRGLAWDIRTQRLLRVLWDDPYLDAFTMVASPEIANPPADAKIAAGDRFTFTAWADGDHPMTYRWQTSTDGLHFTNVTGWLPATGDGQATFSGVAAPEMNGRYYQVEFGNAGGLKFTAPARLFVLSAAGR